MIKKNYLLYGLIGILLSLGFTFFFMKQKYKKYTIGIIQCASNKPLDTLVNSYKKELEKLFEKDKITIIHKNNEGSLVNAHVISEQFHHDKDINLFLTVGSSPSQALSKIEKDRPIIISGISDPGIYEFDKMNNVYGIIDTFDYEAVFNMVKEGIKNINSVAVIRSAGDIAERELAPFKELCILNNIKYFDYLVYNESDIMFAAEMAAKNGDCVLIPCDTLVVSAFPCIIDIAKKYNKPIATCFINGVSMGAYCATGINYKAYGENLATISYDILFKEAMPNIKFQNGLYDKVYFSN